MRVLAYRILVTAHSGELSAQLINKKQWELIIMNECNRVSGSILFGDLEKLIPLRVKCTEKAESVPEMNQRIRNIFNSVSGIAFGMSLVRSMIEYT